MCFAHGRSRGACLFFPGRGLAVRPIVRNPCSPVGVRHRRVAKSGAWEAWRSARALARMGRQKYRFDEGRTLRAAGFRRAGAVACCWQVTRSARRGQGRRRPSPGPDGGCSPSLDLGALQPPGLRIRIAPSRPAPSAPAAASVRRPSEPPCDGTGRIMGAVIPAAGRWRCFRSYISIDP